MAQLGDIGFIGLGNIGLPASINLMKAGFDVVGFSLDGMRQFEGAGGIPARSPADVAARCSIVVQCLPTSDALATAVFGSDGILRNLTRNSVVIELSSYSLSDKERLRAGINDKGAALLDCELTARSAGKTVAERECIIFVGGDEVIAKRMQPVFDGITNHSVFVGGFGASLHLKTVNNLLVAVHIMAAAEALMLGRKAGIDPMLLADILPRGAGGSAALSNYAMRMVEGNFDRDITGQIKVFDKYFDLIEALANKSGAKTPLLDVARTYFRRALAMGHGSEDVSAVFVALQ